MIQLVELSFGEMTTQLAHKALSRREDVLVEKITGPADSMTAYQPAASESTEKEEIQCVPLIPT